MTKSQIIASVAEASGIDKKQATAALEALATLAYENAGDGFTIPGLGKLVKVDRAEEWVVTQLQVKLFKFLLKQY